MCDDNSVKRQQTIVMTQIPTRLKGKNALVTGASSGIGEAIAIRFAREGANVAINYIGEAAEAEAVCRKVEEAGRLASAHHKSIAQWIQGPDQE